MIRPRAGGDRGASHRATLSRRPVPCEGSATIGRVCRALYHGDRRDVEGVPGVGLKRADASLAQDHFVIPPDMMYSALRRLFERGGHAAFEQHGSARFTKRPQ